MEQVQPLKDFFSAIEKDGRISVTHIGIYAVLFRLYIERNCASPMELFSREVMPLAKISSITTFQKCIKELHEYGYLRYEQSFKRNRGSKVFFNT
nr:hypothetical protein [Flavobacterium lindanitolerans]